VTYGQPEWDPAIYHRFSGHRARPALELLARVTVTAPSVVVDLGCGTGEITAAIAALFPEARVIGVDSSAEMLQAAERETTTVEWVHDDAVTWRPDGAIDLLYSNAALHWLTDHEVLFPRLLGYVAPGGQLAVQMPRSWEGDSHRLMRTTLAELAVGPPDLLERYRRRPVYPPQWYAAVLDPLAAALDIWSTTYLQRLNGDDPVLQWVSGTALRPILEELDPADRDRFLGVYRSRLNEAYPQAPDGSTFFPFPRLFIVATRG